MEIKVRELESGSLKGGKKYVMKLGKCSEIFLFSYTITVFFARIYPEQVKQKWINASLKMNSKI